LATANGLSNGLRLFFVPLVLSFAQVSNAPDYVCQFDTKELAISSVAIVREVPMNLGFEFIRVLNKAVVRELERLWNASSKEFFDAFRRNFHGIADL